MSTIKTHLRTGATDDQGNLKQDPHSKQFQTDEKGLQNMQDRKTNVVPFPSIAKKKMPIVDEFENQLLLIEFTLAYAKSKNKRLISAFEQSAKTHNCPTSRALANVIKETDRHLSRILREMSIFELPKDEEGV